MLYPFKLDVARGRVLRIEMDVAAFRAASFLDERILTPQTKGGWVSLQTLLDSDPVPQQPVPPLHFIFHTGHVGSTLVSRLLDETGRVLPLREPLPLRTLAVVQDALDAPAAPPLGRAQFAALVALFVRLWRESDPSAGAVIIKATSSAARLAPALCAAAPDARAIYLNVGAEPYLATLLAGENSSIDLRGHAPERLRRLAAKLKLPPAAPETLSPGELTALSWLAETVTQREVLGDLAGRVLPIDFDGFLANVRGQLGAILRHFDLLADADTVDRIARSRVLTRYSKAPEQPYDPALRTAVLDDARRHHGDEIAKGLRLLKRLWPGVTASTTSA